MIRKLLLPALAAAILLSAACGAGSPAITPTPFVGAWEQPQYSTNDDPLSGSETLSTTLLASDGYIPDGILTVRCTYNSALERENGLEVFITWFARNEDPGSDYRPTVAVRFDDGDVNEDVWSLSTDSGAALVTFAPDADAFISSMKGASRLVARVWKQDQTTITAQWQVAGFRDAVRPIEERCDPNFVPTPTPTPPTPITINDYLWRYKTGDSVNSPAVVDGVVYVGSGDGYLYAVDATSGDLRWRYEAGSWVLSPVVVDGVVYVSSGDDYDYLYAVDATSGDLRWRYEKEGKARVSSLAVSDGVVYFGKGIYMYAMDATTGSLRWRYETESGVSSPSVSDGVVYFGSNDDHLYAVDTETGGLRWRYETGAAVSSSPPAVVDGVVYFGSWDNHLYAVDIETGSLRWRYETDDGVYSPAVVDGVVYFGSADDHLYAVDIATEYLLWRYETGSSVTTSPAVADGVVYFGSWDDHLYAVDIATGYLLWQYDTGDWVESSPAVVDGVVYFGSDDGYLYALDARGR